VIHVYGIVEELDSLPPLAGVDDAPLERRRVGGLELVVSCVPDRPSSEIPRDAVLRHAQVVEELMSRSDAVLPAQFGPDFGDDAELAAAVGTRAPELERGLSRVRGCVEFGLRTLGEAERAEGGPAASSGTEYMRDRLAEEQQRERLLAELHEPLARLARATAVNAGASGSRFTSAYLVPAENVAAFRDAVLRVESACPELTIVCTGPWPPYSFAAGQEDQA
jgi:hypothetical protein